MKCSNTKPAVQNKHTDAVASCSVSGDTVATERTASDIKPLVDAENLPGFWMNVVDVLERVHKERDEGQTETSHQADDSH